MSSFRKAVREQARARVAIDGPAGGGKSFTALRLAFALGSKVAAIDTEFGSLSKYAGDSPDGEGPFDFAVLELKRFSPSDYIAAIRDAEQSRFDVLVIDSLSHAWVGEGGILDQADKSQGRNGFAKWADLTPQHRKLIDAMLGSPLHLIATMRSKTEWVLEKDERTGKTAPRKIGTAPVQRDGMEYEFDLAVSVDQEHLARVHKTRCQAMDGATAPKPTAGFFKPYVDWLRTGTAPSPARQRASQGQVNRIGALTAELPKDTFVKRLREVYHVDSVELLSQEQAEELELKLNGKAGA
jgi:hypothetical protein